MAGPGLEQFLGTDLIQAGAILWTAATFMEVAWDPQGVPLTSMEPALESN